MAFLDTTSRNRKLIVEQHAFKYYFESSEDTMKRLSQQKIRQAEIANRFQDKCLERECRKLEYLQQLRQHKLDACMNSTKESLRQMTASRKVLEELSLQRCCTRDSNFGRYGVSTTFVEIQPLVELEQAKSGTDLIRCERIYFICSTSVDGCCRWIENWTRSLC
jgi:hypothetical protein